MVPDEVATGTAKVRREAATGVQTVLAIAVLTVLATVVLMAHPVPAIVVLTDRRGAKRVVPDRRTKGEAWNNGSTNLSGG